MKEKRLQYLLKGILFMKKKTTVKKKTTSKKKLTLKGKQWLLVAAFLALAAGTVVGFQAYATAAPTSTSTHR